MKPIKIKMYSKVDCPLCVKGKKVLEELITEFSLEIEEIDIYKNEELLEKYQLMIPVVEIDEEEVEYGIIHKDVIRKRLLQKNKVKIVE
ncbi:glutaredoxin family protein [Bacillus sp. PS06]|uniref:glutaredoxin family protein n=1 Tax=Bacillus sp. PS06 TaxID=2764176 RepID=UPI001784BD23|nr:glutaredoxin family protein [Bacillus sp. PS06]MBD8070789.1 glutaredoxin family protein [Bacillus sp. PS06]